MEPSNWASAHSDALREYFAKGMSFAEIGREINARFGTGYTRSAVIGRAKRMGLAAPKRLEGPSLGPTRMAALRAVRPCETRSPGSGETLLSNVTRELPVKLRCVGISPRLISVLELAPGDCRYPYGGDKDGEEISFCGHPRRPGSSYCMPHFRLTRRRGPATQQAAGRVVLRLIAAA